MNSRALVQTLRASIWISVIGLFFLGHGGCGGGTVGTGLSFGTGLNGQLAPGETLISLEGQIHEKSGAEHVLSVSATTHAGSTARKIVGEGTFFLVVRRLKIEPIVLTLHFSSG